MDKRQFLLPFLAILFFFGCSHQPVRALSIPSLSPAKKALIGIGSASAFYGYKLVRHFWKLYAIEKELNNSIVSKGENLPFVTWRNAEFNTPNDINKKANDIASKLKSDQESNPKLDEKELLREKEVLKKWLSDIGNMCDAPGCIITSTQSIDYTFDEDFFKSFSRGLFDNEKLLQCVERNQFGEANNDTLNDLRDNFDQQEAPNIATWLLFRPSWNPWYWVIASCYQKARIVYWEVFKEYVRLKALQRINESPSSTSTTSLGNSLQSIRSDIQQLITDRASADSSNCLKVKWIAILGRVEGTIGNLLDQASVKKNSKITEGLKDVLEKLETTGAQILQSYKPVVDPIVPLLAEAKKKVDEFIKEF